MKLKLQHSYDFNDGIEIDSDRIKNWHNQIIKSIKDGCDASSHASGNSIVIGTKVNVSGEGQILRIIEVTNGYKIYEYEIKK